MFIITTMLNIRLHNLRARKIAFCFCFLCASVALQANTNTELFHLTQIVDEINRLTTLIDRAEQARDPNKRLQFQYDWLRKDLRRVVQGIEDYVTEYNLTPRQFDELNGAYAR